MQSEPEPETQSVCAAVGALTHAFEPACVEVSRLMRLPCKLHRHQNTPRRCKTDAFDESVRLPRQSTGVQVAWHWSRQWIFTASLLLLSQSCFTRFPLAKPPSRQCHYLVCIYEFSSNIRYSLFRKWRLKGKHCFVQKWLKKKENLIKVGHLGTMKRRDLSSSPSISWQGELRHNTD